MRSLLTIRTTALIAATLLLLAPDAAWACAVCFDPNESSRFAFMATTALLSFLPLGLVGGTVFWIWRRSKELDAEDAAAVTP